MTDKGLKYGFFRGGIILIFCIYLMSCGTNNTPNFENGSDRQVALNKINQSDLSYSIKKLFEDTSHNIGFNIYQLIGIDTLSDYYSSNHYNSIWTERIIKWNLADSIIRCLETCESHGLELVNYNYGVISQLLSDFKYQLTKYKSIDYEELALLDILISNSLVNYSLDLSYGRTNPDSIYGRWFSLPNKDRLKADIFAPLEAKNISIYFSGIEPKGPRYKGLQKAIKKLKNLRGRKGWYIIPDTISEIEPGDTSEYLHLVANHLMLTGELDSIEYLTSIANRAVEILKQKKDSAQNYLYGYYDTIMAKAVIKYQQNQGLHSEGCIGKLTLRQLNKSLEERICQIKINMDRCRWFEEPEEDKYLLVNIPDFHLYCIKNDSVKHKIRVCTGKKREKNFDEKMKRYLKTKNKKLRPKNHETPTMKSNVTFIVLNPEWLVPKSIAEDEMLYKIIKDKEYLNKQNLELFEDGEQLDPNDIDWESYKTGDLPFRIKQQPGKINSLGKMKFYFNNPFSIYLHDTPMKSKFIASNRAVSHGCIRVQEPMKLSEFLINGNKRWDVDDIRIELGNKPTNKEDKKVFKKKMEKWKDKQEELEENDYKIDPKRIILHEKVPIYVDYYTVWLDENDIIQFRRDVYEKDKLVGKVLFSN